MQSESVERRRVLRMAIVAGLTGVLSVAGAAGVVAQESAGDGKATVRIAVRLGEMHEGRRTVTRSVELTAVDRGGPGRVEAGWRLPIPVQQGEDSVVRSYQYQDLGLSVIVRVEVLDDRRIRLRGHLEDSSLDERATEDAPGALPTVRTFGQDLNAVVAAGEPLVVGSIMEAGGTSHFVEIEAEILD